MLSARFAREPNRSQQDTKRRSHDLEAAAVGNNRGPAGEFGRLAEIGPGTRFRRDVYIGTTSQWRSLQFHRRCYINSNQLGAPRW